MKFARVSEAVFKKYNETDRWVVASITDHNIGICDSNKDVRQEFDTEVKRWMNRYSGLMYVDMEVIEHQGELFIAKAERRDGTKEQVVVRLVVDLIFE